MNDQHRDTGAYVRRLAEMDKSALPADGGEHFNRLIFATSPYLLQHAENPVDWYPWGDEAFRKAEAEDKPIFLSIGYATCHWCHVMAQESFEDAEVAAVLNRLCVAVKVDREERPDIDDQYMTVARMMTGGGGWPLTILMAPDKRPFFAATYLPKFPRQGMPGIMQLLEKIAELWHMDRERVERNCAANADMLRRLAASSAGALPGDEVFRSAQEQLAAMYDPEWGGFGQAPKFPMPVNLMFLLRFWKRTGDQGSLDMVRQTLRMIRCGGIYDQIGGGIHRYAVDRQWLVPHFEKMLYDQALVAAVSLETFQATGDALYRELAEDIFTYVLREMTSPEGGFFAGLDADSEGEEGTFYLWTPAELTGILGEDAALFCRLHGVSERGNFEGRNILHLPIPPGEFAEKEGIPLGLLEADRARWRELVLAARELRIRPFRDEKVLTGWNGLMIAALAKGYAVTGNDRYRQAAGNAVRFVLERLRTPTGRLLRSWYRQGADVPAFLDDYAFFIQGLWELFCATLDRRYQDEAVRLCGDMLRLFGDGKGDGLCDTGSDVEQVIVRTKSAADAVIPSGNGVAALALLRLGRTLGNGELTGRGEEILRGFMGSVTGQPAGYLALLAVLDYHRGPEVEITIAGRLDSAEASAMLRAVGRHYIPNLVLRGGGGEKRPEVNPCPGKAVAYLCGPRGCREPACDAATLQRLLADC